MTFKKFLISSLYHNVEQLCFLQLTKVMQGLHKYTLIDLWRHYLYIIVFYSVNTKSDMISRVHYPLCWPLFVTYLFLKVISDCIRGVRSIKKNAFPCADPEHFVRGETVVLFYRRTPSVRQRNAI